MESHHRVGFPLVVCRHGNRCRTGDRGREAAGGTGLHQHQTLQWDRLTGHHCHTQTAAIKPEQRAGMRTSYRIYPRPINPEVINCRQQQKNRDFSAVCFLRQQNPNNRGADHPYATTMVAALPRSPDLVTTICFSIFSFSSATWDMMPTSRFPSVRPARVV